MQPAWHHVSFRWCLLALFILCSAAPGCRTTAGIYVWSPPTTLRPISAERVAIAPLLGPPQLAIEIEDQLLAQRPVQCRDVAVLSPAELQAASPVRLASTTPLQHDALAIAAAARAGAEVVLQGEVIWADLPAPPPSGQSGAPRSSMAAQVRRWIPSSVASPLPRGRATVAWRLERVEDRRLLAAQVVSYDVRRAVQEYPDLVARRDAPQELLAAAMARESWKMLGPWVRREQVRLAQLPWMPGAGRVWLGNRAAQRGDWPTAEHYWQSALDWFPWNPAARHNLALAQVAREDIEGAQATLDTIPLWLSPGLPRDTKYWVENKRETYRSIFASDTATPAVALPDQGAPAEDSGPPLPSPDEVTPIELTDPPWWPHFKPESPT
ncbi:MAG: tetratricopeptide repeat protein [Planctomycetota bacterium]|nr:MAG: tetratricopeptide repeat protein [Planctomycetota bacterium]